MCLTRRYQMPTNPQRRNGTPALLIRHVGRLAMRHRASSRSDAARSLALRSRHRRGLRHDTGGPLSCRGHTAAAIIAATSGYQACSWVRDTKERPDTHAQHKRHALHTLSHARHTLRHARHTLRHAQHARHTLRHAQHARHAGRLARRAATEAFPARRPLFGHDYRPPPSCNNNSIVLYLLNGSSYNRRTIYIYTCARRKHNDGSD